MDEITRFHRLWVVFVNVAVFIGMAVLIEGCVRVFNPDIQPLGTDRALIQDNRFGDTAGPRPGATGRSNGALRHVDERGFWAYSAARPDKPGWLFLGDSVTMGLGVSDDSTFAGIVARAQDSLDVLNASLPGHASDDYVAILQSLLGSAETGANAQTGADIARITVFWCLNDVMAGLPVATAPTGVRVLNNRFMAFVRRNVATYAWIKATFTDRPMQYYLHDKQLYDPEQGYVDAALSDLGEIQALADAHSVPVQVVLLPYEYSLRTGDVLPHTVMKSALERMGIRVFDMADALAGVEESDRLYLYGDGIHFSEYGHQQIARVLIDRF